MAVITFAAAGLPGLAAAAEFHVTSAECDGPGTFRGEVENAEANPGHDTVIVDPDFVERIDITQCGPTLFNGNYGGTPLWNFSYVYVSDDLTIDGNGVLIEGNIEWVANTGARNRSESGRYPPFGNPRAYHGRNSLQGLHTDQRDGQESEDKETPSCRIRVC
jgi:hypothetical protein